MAEVVRLECGLEAVGGQRVRCTEHASIEDENIQRTVPDINKHHFTAINQCFIDTAPIVSGAGSMQQWEWAEKILVNDED